MGGRRILQFGEKNCRQTLHRRASRVLSVRIDPDFTEFFAWYVICLFATDDLQHCVRCAVTSAVSAVGKRSWRPRAVV